MYTRLLVTMVLLVYSAVVLIATDSSREACFFQSLITSILAYWIGRAG